MLDFYGITLSRSRPRTVAERERVGSTMAVETLDEHRDLAGITSIHCKYEGVVYTGRVLDERVEEDGEVTARKIFRITKNGETKDFTSPSSAGSFIRGGKATNGWTFWRPGDPPLVTDDSSTSKPKRGRKPKGDAVEEVEEAELVG
jgi:hypothetical protein